MGKHAQYRKRGSHSGAAGNSLAAPVLAADGIDGLAWSWSGVDPDHWSIQASDDGGASWNEQSTELGDVRDTAGLEFHPQWRIVGRSALDVDVTAPSNTITR